MKPRLTIWGQAGQFIVHRGADRMLFDMRGFPDEAACWAAVQRWLDGETAAFELENHLVAVRVGFFARYQRVWRGVERV